MRHNGTTSGHEIEPRDDQIIISRSDFQGRIVYVNADFIEISGFSEEELLGQPHNIVRHPEMPREVFADLWRDLHAGRPWIGVIKNRTKNGDTYWVEAHVSPIWEKGSVSGYMSMRRKASPTQIRDAESTYAAMRANPKLALNFRHGIQTKDGLIERLTRGYRDARLTTKLILASLPATILVLGLVTYFLAAYVSKTLNENAHQQLRHDISLLRAAITARIDSANIEAIEHSRILSERLNEALGGERKGSLAALEALTKQKQNLLTHFMRDMRGVATIFVRTPNGLQRRLSNVVNESGNSVIDSYLATDHPAHALLLAGKPYLGPSRAFGHQYQAYYTPIFDASGSVIGTIVIGIDMDEQLATLKAQMRSMKIGETGYYYIADATPGPDFGRMILHPYQEGKILADAIERSGLGVIAEMANKRQGELSYTWKNPEAGEEKARMKLVIFETLDEPRWLIAGGTSIDELTALSKNIAWLVIAGGLAVALAVFTIILLVLNKLVLKPLNTQVLPTFQAISDGRFEIRLDIRSNDEIGRVIQGLESLRNRLSFENERERTLSRLRENARQEAENLSRARAEFLANMSHEIRTPLNAVIGLAYLLMQSKLGQRDMEYVKRIEGAGKLLLAIINDILDFSKIDAGRMQLEEAPFRLDDVLDNLSNLVRTRVQEKGLVLEYVVSPNTPQKLVGDALRLSQILINLVSNAIKFTSSGSITVHVDAQRPADGRVELFFRVIDTGIGMTDDQLSNLFRAFSQADSSVTRKFGGTGLGLVICKRLIEMMGGTIGVDSQPQHGSTFGFTVWLGTDTGATTQLTKTGYRVLVVDDNELARKILEQLLVKIGCIVRMVDSGKAALAALRDTGSRPFDCVMVDLNMPDMDGLELAHQIRSENMRNTKLVMVTGENVHSGRYRNALDDFDDVIEKPVTAARINDVLIALQEKEAAGDSEFGAAPLAGLRILVAEDVPTNQLIMRDLLESLGATIEIADNGALAVQKIKESGDNIDLILMDIQMPEVDGLEATRRIRAGTTRHEIPIIALTAHALEEERQRAITAGMNDFLSKPIEPEQLIAVIQRWRPKLMAKTATVVTPAANALPGTDFSALYGIDVDDGLRRMLNRQPLFEKILRDFESRFNGETTRIREALGDDDLEVAERRAHSVKGTGGMISAKQLALLAAELEQAIKLRSPDISDCLNRFDDELKAVLAGIKAALSIE